MTYLEGGPFDPFTEQAVEAPNPEYFSDRSVWGAYKASLEFHRQAERERASHIVREFIPLFDESLRERLWEMVSRIEDLRKDKP